MRLRRAVALLLLGLVPTPATRAAGVSPSRLANSDLSYITPARFSDEGQPIGNGAMGSLVWTTPTAIKLQLNRADVFGVDSTTMSFPRAHTEYASGCAYVDVEVAEATDPAFQGDAFRQHLSVADGVMSIDGKGLRARLVADQSKDVFAIEVDDQRAQPTPVRVSLRMLRYAQHYVRGTPNDFARRHVSVVQTNAHTATSTLKAHDGRRVSLTQESREGDFYNASAAAATVLGRTAATDYPTEDAVRITVPPARGKVLILLSTAGSFDAKDDVAERALAQFPKDTSLDQIRQANQTFWDDYWSRSAIELHSDDGAADEVERHYNYFLYVMSCCSRRSAYPARFGGLLFYTNGDMRSWGSQYWWANQSCYYNGLLPADRPELLDPTFAMYTGMYGRCALAAEQQWGSKGIWIPETTFFNGPPRLPDDVAAEMRDLYLMRKPWASRSDRFQRYAEVQQSFNSRWNWIAQGGAWVDGRYVPQDKGYPPFGHVTHIFGSGAKIAYLYWLRYEYTQDRAWLRDRAYPMLKGVTEFYRNFPNLKKEADGKYHTHFTNSNEPAWGVRDSDEDLCAMRGVLGTVIRASEILDTDRELRPVWREFLNNLAPLPVSTDPDALVSGPTTATTSASAPATQLSMPRDPVWVKGRKPAVKPGGLLPDGNTLPHWNFDLATPEADAPTLKLANATLDAFLRRAPGAETRVGTLSRLPIAAAALGRSEAVRNMIPAQIRADDAGRNNAPGVLANRMALREGPGAVECERLGRAAEALHTALLQSNPPFPGKDPILRVFPAFPPEWSGKFTLAARGGFVVTAASESGTVKSVEILSRAGATCRLRNPWPGKSVTLTRGAGAPQSLAGDLLTIPTSPGETIRLAAQP